MMAVGKLSGAVGTYSNIDPFVEKYVCEKLELTPVRLATQVIQRDRHAHFMTTLAIIGSSLDKMATEIRNLQRTDIREAEEYFAPGQRVLPLCRINVILSPAKRFPVWLACCAVMQ